MKYTKYIVLAAVIAVSLMIGVAVKQPAGSLPSQGSTESEKATEHLYVSWDTMEFDKCVAVWLIVRFIDKDAEFVLYPQGTEITEGTMFDVPGADWSRKHRKCTSQCILETLDNPDSAIEKIVSIAGKIELNFWQLDRWPEARRCFNDVKKITDVTDDPVRCFEKTMPYFDRLYSDFRSKSSIGNKVSFKRRKEDGARTAKDDFSCFGDADSTWSCSCG